MKIAPSILAADLARLADAQDICTRGGAEIVHVDVMDGHFVPNLSFGPPVIDAFAAGTSLELDVHLMVSNPDRLLDAYLEHATWVSVHQETTVHLDRTVSAIREAGSRAGVALNPATPITTITDLLPRLDFVLLMSVNPGFAGQSMIEYVLEKARRLRDLIDSRGLDCLIEMDGGIKLNNVDRVAEAGVDIAVIGSGVFAADDPVATLVELTSGAATSRKGVA